MKMIDFKVCELLERTRDKSANPGGGALVTLVGNLAFNLILMMDKKDYGEDNGKANEKKQRILLLSDKLTSTMQEDIDSVTRLIDSYKDKDMKDRSELVIGAIKPPVETIEIMMEGLDLIEFFLKNGKKETLSDGEISNRLIYEVINSSIINIEINQKFVEYDFDKENILQRAKIKFNRNQKIIEGRKK